MKINDNQVVTGMFVYDASSEYTTNDFVIKDQTIYVCTKDVQGEDPETSDSFTIYLGDQSVDLSEYLEFLDEAEGENKYLSVGMLQGVLSTYMVGPTGKGIIGDYIYYDSDSGLQVKLRGESQDSVYTDPETVLTDIMAHKDINHALLRVSRLLPEIFGYVGSLSVSEFSSLDEKSCILRQFTYLQEGSGDTIRVQELIDPIDGMIWFRSGNLSSGFSSSTNTWKCSVVNSKSLKEKVETILGVYSSRLKIMRSLESHLKSNFRFRRLSLPGGRVTTVTYQGSGENEDTDYISEPGELNIVVSEQIGTGLVKNHETTLNLADKLNDQIPDYVVGDYRLSITENADSSYTINLYNKASDSTPGTAWISGVYYKEYYGLS